MYIVWSLMILVGCMIWSSQCCVLKNGCRLSDPSLVFAGRMVFDTPTGTLNGQPMEDEKHFVIIQQPRFKLDALSFPIPFRGSGVGKVWRVPESTPATVCKAPPTTDTDCFLPPDQLKNVREDVTRKTESGIQLLWDPPSVTNVNIIKYEIRYRAIERSYDRSFNGEDFQQISVLAHTLQKSEYFLGNLEPSTMYQVHIYACTFIKKGPCVTITANTKATRDLEPVDVDDLPPPERSEGEWVIICLPPLKQEYATGYIIQVVEVRRRGNSVEVKYRAAFINKTDNITKFIVGDGEQYGIYTNKPLLEDQDYEVYIGVVSTVGEDTYIEWSDPIFIEAFVIKPFPFRLVIIIGLIFMICIFAIISIMIVSRRDKERREISKRNIRGNRRNLALPEIPSQDGERYKVFTASTKSRGSELDVPMFDPYGVDFPQNSDEIGKSHAQMPNGVFDMSTGVDIARIQNRRLPAKPPPETLGTYVKSQNHQVWDKTEGFIADTEGTTRQLYHSEDEKTKGEGKGYSENLRDFETKQKAAKKGKNNKKRNGMAMSKTSLFPWKQAKSIPDFGDEYDDTVTDTFESRRFPWKQEKSIPDFGDEYDDTVPDTSESRRFPWKQDKHIPDFGDEYDETVTDTSESGRFPWKQEKSIPDFGDEYDETVTDTATERKKSKKKDKRNGMAMSRIARFSRKKENTCPDFGDTYDETDVDTVTGGKKENDLQQNENECRYSIPRFGEDCTSVIYEVTVDAQDSNAVAPCTSLVDIYEETEVSSGDDGYEDAEEVAGDRKKILSQAKEPSKKNSEKQIQECKKEKKNKTNKKWFQWKHKDAPVTANLGKENTKVIPTAEVNPLERNRVNYSGHLYPRSSVKTDEQTGGFLGGKTGKQVDVDQFNDIYEDTNQMEKKENTTGSITHPRPPSNPPWTNINEIGTKWNGMRGANNTQHNAAVQPKDDQALGNIKDYGGEYDETAVVSNCDVTTAASASAPAPLLPPKPVQVVIPSCGRAVQKKSKESCHRNDEELYEDTGEGELYEDTRSLDSGDELYEVI